MERSELIVELSTLSYPTNDRIASSDTFYRALREPFYPPGYLHNFLARWLQLRQLSNRSAQGYIDVFCKICIQLHFSEPGKVLIINFNSGLLLPLRREVHIFVGAYLDKDFLRVFAIERKVSPHI